jgi:hypothetical protein
MFGKQIRDRSKCLCQENGRRLWRIVAPSLGPDYGWSWGVAVALQIVGSRARSLRSKAKRVNPRAARASSGLSAGIGSLQGRGRNRRSLACYEAAKHSPKGNNSDGSAAPSLTRLSRRITAVL